MEVKKQGTKEEAKWRVADRKEGNTLVFLELYLILIKISIKYEKKNENNSNKKELC